MLDPTTTYRELTPEEAREQGILQEANRLFFHPLGLTLAVAAPLTSPDDWEHARFAILDARDAPESVVFGPGDTPQRLAKVARVREQALAARELRDAALGFNVQPEEQL